MRLSKQERMAVLIIAVIIILGLGIFLFIVPQFQNIGTSNTQLVAKQQELQSAEERAATRVQLGQDVYAAYEDGQNIADMFFEEMKPYQADNEIREFIQFCKDKGVAISVDSLSIGAAGVSELGVTFNEESEIVYDLKTFARGDSDNGELSEEQQRTAILQEALANVQSVGSIDVSFTVSALEQDDLLKFFDCVNDYEKSDGVRKAIRVSSGITIDYQDVQEKYDQIIENIAPDVRYDALRELAAESNVKIPTKQEIKEALGIGDTNNNQQTQTDGEDNAAANTNANKNDTVGEISEDYVYSAEVTLTMYSLERMQDPTDKLAEQDQRVAG